MPLNTSLKAALLGAGIVTGLTAPVMAQETAPETTPEATPMAPAAEQADYSEDKLQSFVTAALEVTEIQNSYVATLNEAAPEEQQGLVEQANGEMAAAIEETPGITVEEYLEIGEAAQADPALSDRIGEIAAELQAQ